MCVLLGLYTEVILKESWFYSEVDCDPEGQRYEHMYFE